MKKSSCVILPQATAKHFQIIIITKKHCDQPKLKEEEELDENRGLEISTCLTSTSNDNCSHANGGD